jgi:hypothetical protein
MQIDLELPGQGKARNDEAIWREEKRVETRTFETTVEEYKHVQQQLSDTVHAITREEDFNKKKVLQEEKMKLLEKKDRLEFQIVRFGRDPAKYSIV